MGIKKPPYRLWIALVIFSVAYITYTMQVNISQSVISTITVQNEVDLASIIANRVLGINETFSNFTPATWSAEVLSHAIDAYYWGLVIFSAPSCLISARYGPYNTILYSLILMVFTNSLSVRAAEWHYAPLIVCRIIVGALSGAIIPALQMLISNWSTPAEKGKFTSTLMGSSLGMLISWTLIAPVSRKFGWDWGFHFLSIQAAVICLIFGILASDRPAENKWISSDEKKIIKEYQGRLVSNTKGFPPYRKILTSKPFGALCIGHCGSRWGFYVKLCLIDAYIMSYHANPFIRLYSSTWLEITVPLILEIVLGVVSGFVDDLFKLKMPLYRTNIRRWFAVSSHIVPGLILLVIWLFQYLQVTLPGAYMLLVIASACTGTSVGSDLQNVHDLAPNHAGSMYGLINSIAWIPALFVLPTFTKIVADFKIVLITGCIYIISGVLFAVFASAQTQPWNDTDKQTLEEEMPMRTENNVNNGGDDADVSTRENYTLV